LYWFDHERCKRGLNIRRNHANDIINNNKRIENRHTRWRDVDYIWLRTTRHENASSTSLPGSHIIALMYLDRPVTAFDGLSSQQAEGQEQWYLSQYEYHYPIRHIWRLPTPIAFAPPHGTVNIFKVPKSIIDIIQT
jgi:hypothetical protein